MCVCVAVNSDLYLKISQDGLSAAPATHDGFAMMWAGVRGTYGVTAGKVAFQTKVSWKMVSLKLSVCI